MAARKKRAVPKYKVFGDRLQFFREQRGMDQLTLGRESGYRSGSAITQMEQGTYNPTLDKIIKIAAVLRIPPWWLLSNDGTTHDPSLLDLRHVPRVFHHVLGELIQTIREQCYDEKTHVRSGNPRRPPRPRHRLDAVDVVVGGGGEAVNG